MLLCISSCNIIRVDHYIQFFVFRCFISSFSRTKDQTVTIENTPSKNVILSNLEETVSAHTILAGTPNGKEDMKEDMTSMDIDDMLMEVRKNKHKEYISYISTEHSKAPSILSNTELEVSNKTNIPDKNTDVEEWKPGTSLIVEDSMIAGLREGKLSRNRKVKVHFFAGTKTKDFYYYLVPLLKKKSDNIILHFGINDAPYKNEDEIYKELKSIKDFIKKRHPSCKVYISAPILRLNNKNTNSILKKYVDKLKVVEEKSVILHDNILLSHLNKDGLHLSSYDSIKLVGNFISRIRMF